MTTPKVVGLRGRKISPDGADQGIIDLCRELLELAERGELRGLAAICVKGDDEIGTKVRHVRCRHLLIAGAVYLQQDLSKED